MSQFPGLHASVLACALAACMPASAGPAPSPPAWRDTIELGSRRARVVADGAAWRLRTPDGERWIPAAARRAETASPMFDALYALALAELEEAKVERIRDDAFDRGRPIDCACFETGEKWPYVWTRDLAYSVDLALARLEPARAKAALRFKLGATRGGADAGVRAVAQDTGSGGSWPISTDRVVWFLAAAHLLDDRAFADDVWSALTGTLAQDRATAFDPEVGLYRGETSFLDWREQTYPVWTKEDVRFIGESFALSTNVLHVAALRLGARMARERGDARAIEWAAQAEALTRAIDARFWREDRGLYMAYVGTAAHPVPFEAYDLLGTSLAILHGVAPRERARRALANYPTLDTGSPVVWPQQPGIPIYHNRAMWPFVSAYALRAARAVVDAERIAHELRTLMRGAALAGSHMENYELTTQTVRFEDGDLSGPVVNSKRQLWSVAGYLDAVRQGVFGLTADGAVEPELPRELLPMLFGERASIALDDGDRRIVLLRPRADDVRGALLVAGDSETHGRETRVQLVGREAPAGGRTPRRADAFAPPSPGAPSIASGAIEVATGQRLYVDGRAVANGATRWRVPDGAHCASLTRVGADGLESLHSPTTCIGPSWTLDGAPPRSWTAPASGRYRVHVRYANPHGPINTGITAAVKRWRIDCDGVAAQSGPLVMPHGVRVQDSTSWTFEAARGSACRFAIDDGFNMSRLDHFARYTGGAGGQAGPLNAATIEAVVITPASGESE